MQPCVYISPSHAKRKWQQLRGVMEWKTKCSLKFSLGLRRQRRHSEPDNMCHSQSHTTLQHMGICKMSLNFTSCDVLIESLATNSML